MPDEGPIYTLSGVNGQLDLYSNRIVIRRKGALAKMTQGFFKGNKEILLTQIASVQVKPGTALTNGYIQFTIPGGNEGTGGLTQATQDENTVMFTKKNNDLVKQIKEKVYELQTSANTRTAPAKASEADELLKFKQLLDQGVITQDEFDAKKSQILGL